MKAKMRSRCEIAGALSFPLFFISEKVLYRFSIQLSVNLQCPNAKK